MTASRHVKDAIYETASLRLMVANLHDAIRAGQLATEEDMVKLQRNVTTIYMQLGYADCELDPTLHDRRLFHVKQPPV